jgi:hypothetical protein
MSWKIELAMILIHENVFLVACNMPLPLICQVTRLKSVNLFLKGVVGEVFVICQSVTSCVCDGSPIPSRVCLFLLFTV